jgi:LAO/AO transport system kinase
VEVAGLADICVVVLVPEGGDDIQSIKSGLMEIADIFVVNKSDREGAQTFANHLKKMVHQQTHTIPVISTIASKNNGLDELIKEIQLFKIKINSKKPYLLVEKAWRLIQNDRMKDVKKQKLQQEIVEASKDVNFNLYQFIERFKNS